MKSYSALLSFRIQNAAGLIEDIIEETWYQIAAKDEDTAKTMAIDLGMKEEKEFQNRYGETVKWQFQAIRMLEPDLKQQILKPKI